MRGRCGNAAPSGITGQIPPCILPHSMAVTPAPHRTLPDDVVQRPQALPVRPAPHLRVDLNEFGINRWACELAEKQDVVLDAVKEHDVLGRIVRHFRVCGRPSVPAVQWSERIDLPPPRPEAVTHPYLVTVDVEGLAPFAQRDA